MSRISMLGIEIPLEVEDFITPDWHRVMDFHVKWKALVIEAGDEPWAFQPYFLHYLKLLVKTGHRGRSEERWMERINNHFGALSFFEGFQIADRQTPGGSDPLPTAA
jgi:hypothetical protein